MYPAAILAVGPELHAAPVRLPQCAAPSCRLMSVAPAPSAYPVRCDALERAALGHRPRAPRRLPSALLRLPSALPLASAPLPNGAALPPRTVGRPTSSSGQMDQEREEGGGEGERKKMRIF
ncbi:hypothetical protein PR202_ga16923 [Eleusine coracana subsp. coracana]|uniref:Uncharacterized protein n=1 Tax=Eleusine coracana subsp. coracana TaxID=191504 RepID=A0AAV5CP54_ELECO|nr:hypothetical protein PR202_ga16923 [Eleusine coracana subsp. coracana]